jgi:PilZ domain-containing protein
MVRESKRAADIMARRQDEQRASARTPINQPGTVTFQSTNKGREHVAHVRDVSAEGVYFYSDFAPDTGATVVLRFLMPVLDRKMRLECHAQVLRVEANAQGAAIGVAARMRLRQFLDCASA